MAIYISPMKTTLRGLEGMSQKNNVGLEPLPYVSTGCLLILLRKIQIHAVLAFMLRTDHRFAPVRMAYSFTRS